MTNPSLQNLDDIAARAVNHIQQATELTTLEDLRVQYLGKKGELTTQLKQIGGLSPAERPLFGDKVNQIKKQLAEAISAKNKSWMCSDWPPQLLQKRLMSLCRVVVGKWVVCTL